MSTRSHFFLVALASALLYYHLTLGYSLGFLCTWSTILMMLNHLLDIAVDSSRLQWIKRSAFVVFCVAFLFRVVIAVSLLPSWDTWQSLGLSLVLVAPIGILVWIPIARSTAESEIADTDRL